MGHIRFFLRFVGIRVIARPQCKSAEYYFHHRPSFAVESSIIYVTTFYKTKKCILRGSTKLFHIIHFSDSSSKLGFTFKFTIKKLPSSTEPVQTCPIKPVLFFKNKFENTYIKKMGWGKFAHAFMGHIRACLFNVVWLLVNCTACISVPTALRKLITEKNDL